MKINIITSFPEFFFGVFCSLLKKAIENNLVIINIINIRKYGIGNHSKIDDYPFGGGAGMILRADVIEKALEDNFNLTEFNGINKKIVLTSPRGKIFDQNIAKEFSKLEEIIIICNRYEGIDQRAIEYFNLEEISIGNYILMGGEVAATCIIESSVRLLNDVLGNKKSIMYESFSDVNLEYTEHNHFTKPRVWNGIEVPNVLLSGNHANIEKWKENK